MSRNILQEPVQELSILVERSHQRMRDTVLRLTVLIEDIAHVVVASDLLLPGVWSLIARLSHAIVYRHLTKT